MVGGWEGKYWVWNGTEAEGPVDVETLRARNDLASLRLCRVGEEDWRLATEFPAIAPPPKPAGSSGCRRAIRLFLIAGFTLVAGAAAIAGYAWHRGLLALPTADEVVSEIRAEVPGGDLLVAAPGAPPFDLVLSPPCDPLGLAVAEGALLVGNRSARPSLLRLRPVLPGTFRFERVSVREPTYDQEISIHSLARGSDRVVGLATAFWIRQGEGCVFTLHDSATLALAGTAPAPPFAGAAAWDGADWWVGVRKNTRESPEAPALHRLDRDLRVRAAFPAPGSGCQGLVWDGRYLWWADVFSDALHRIAIESGVPREVGKHATGVDYLSGVAWDGSNLWIAEYGTKTLRRVSTDAYASWTGLAVPSVSPVPASAPAAGAHERKENRLALDTGPEDADYLFLDVTAREGKIRGAWRIWVGPAFFRGDEGAPPLPPGAVTATLPKFVRLEVTVRQTAGGSSERKNEIPVTPGWNEVSDRILAEGLAPGTYNVSLFLHAQYRRPDDAELVKNVNLAWAQVSM